MTAAAEAIVTVIGAGPAGLAAAVHAGECGASVVLVDAGARIGGQYWRHSAQPRGLAPDLHHDLDTFTALSTRAEKLIADGRIRYLPSHHVWSLDAGEQGCRVRALDHDDPLRPSEVCVDSDYLVLAPGAFDRQVPFPGWELPGVITVGAAQAMLKGNGVVVGPRVLVAGCGPFLLPVAAGLVARGATVVGVHEANHPAGWLKHLRILAGHRRKIAEAVGYHAKLARHRVAVRNRSVVVEAHGTDRLQAVTVAKRARDGSIRMATRRRIEIDVLAIGYGFTAQTELALAAGCAVRVSAQQTLAVVTDDEQRTTNHRVFAAGEITGIGGAQMAVQEGKLAGAAVSRAAGFALPPDAYRQRDPAAQRDHLRRFAKAMHAVYPVPTGWLDIVTPSTTVCRCEEVTVADIDAAVELAAHDMRTVKLLSRAGMGWCQGRECGYATACLIAARTGRALDLTGAAERAIATPVPLGLVAQGSETPRTSNERIPDEP